MSAIFGVYNLNGKPVSSKLLEEMSAILSHRGVDNSGVWSEEGVGLGHRMLKTTPEADNEKLPFERSDKSLVITADARLDNRKELIDFLGPFEKPQSLITNSELILYAYEKWGETCAEHLLGDFAFVIWDLRKRQLFCARDQFGIKPFYYYSSKNLFAFATEIKALLLVPEIPKRLNEVKIANHLGSTFDQKEITFYQDIFRLLPGYGATINREGKKIFSYWSLKLPPELNLKSDSEYAEALRERFTEAVQCRLHSAVPIGTMLSGGIDSSSITCVARKLLAEEKTNQLHTFSAVFDQVKECDERQYINAVLRENSVSPHFIIADSYGPFTDIDEILKFQDEPLIHSNLYINWLSYKTAKANGIKVILDGYDGDSTVSHGLGFFTELAQERRWAKLASEIISYSKRTNRPWHGAVWSWIWGFGLKPRMDESRVGSRVMNDLQRVKGRLGSNKKTAANHNQPRGVVLNQGFAKRVNVAEIPKTKRFVPRTERDNHLYNLTDNGSPSSSLEVLNCAAGAFSIELRFPFWDKRLIEFCLSLPAEQKIKKGWTRMVMRRAMNGILPPEIQWRAWKTDLAPSFNYGLLKFGREVMDNFIVKNPGIIVEYVDIKSLREAYQRFLKSEASLKDVISIQRCIFLALWLQKTG
jgi:asparagine synthase (glutamine-hydrolysing)